MDCWLKKKKPELKPKAKRMLVDWMKVTEEEKAKYEALAAEDKARYEKECEEAGIELKKPKEKAIVKKPIKTTIVKKTIVKKPIKKPVNKPAPARVGGQGYRGQMCKRRTTGSLEVIKVSLETELKTLSKYAEL